MEIKKGTIQNWNEDVIPLIVRSGNCLVLELVNEALYHGWDQQGWPVRHRHPPCNR